MTRWLAIFVFLAALILSAPTARTAARSAPDTPDPALQNADLAWDRGDYVAALSGYLQLLDGPNADAVLEPIALTTGELYHTTEITTDGALPKFSPDGRYFVYESGTGARRVTRI